MAILEVNELKQYFYINPSLLAKMVGGNNQGQLLSSGVYFYRLSTPHGVEQRKAILLK